MGDADNTGAARVFVREGDTWMQQGPKLVGTGATWGSSQGSSVALSSDGNIALVGGQGDSSKIGAAWVYTRAGGVWTQQGPKLVGTGTFGPAWQGRAVALSQDGRTAAIGGHADSAGFGAVWIFVHTPAGWVQEGNKIVASGYVGLEPYHGMTVTLSGDGNTMIAGAPGDSGLTGAARVYVRKEGAWAQEGGKLLPDDVSYHAWFGRAVALSADGNTAVIGAADDESTRGATWVYRRLNGQWTQEGHKIVGADGAWNSKQGWSVAISADASTMAVGGLNDNEGFGAVWVFADTGFVAPPELPGIPALLSPPLHAGGKPTAVSLQWASAERATRYHLQVATDSAMGVPLLVNDTTITDTVHLVSGLPYDAAIYWRVCGVNSAGAGEFSAIGTFTTIIDTPAVPVAVAPANGATGMPLTVELRWHRSVRAMVYHAEVALDSSFSGVPLLTDSTITDTVRIFEGLSYASTYYWRVRAVNAGGRSGWSGSRRFSTLLADPRIPVLASPGDNATGLDTVVTVRWYRLPETPAGSVGFILEAGPDSTFAPGPGLRVVQTADTFAVLSGLGFLTDYWWRVKTRFDNATDGPYAVPWKFRTGLSLPGTVTLLLPAADALVGRDSLVLSWRRTGPMVTRYCLEYSVDSAFTLVRMDSTLIDTTAIITVMVKNTTHYWRVRARNVSGWGPFPPARRFLRTATGVAVHGQEIPDRWVLEQNYPNPFNPTTIIRFGLPERAEVELAVFNTLGQKVAELVRGGLEPGFHEAGFTASGLPSGVYFYRLIAGTYIQTRRLLLVR